QFLAPWDICNVIEKVTCTGNENVLLTERGTSFGYNNLVTDMRSLAIMRSFGYPVVYDATHSVQLPGAGGDRSGGQRELVPQLARAATATGIDALFIEVHEDPSRALCDGPNSVSLDVVGSLLTQIKKIDRLVKDSGS
ncbi:MAG: 3-deoxy-8-phosphooctulonate synthase, partial [Thermodesulfobacteriota bacterium]